MADSNNPWRMGITKGRCWLALGLALAMTLTLWKLVSAVGPPEDGPNPDAGRRVGLVSTAVECLAVKAGTPDSVSATVHLEWKGQIEDAFLVLSAAGSQGGHSIYVNGQLVGSAPVRPGGQPCLAGLLAYPLISTDFIPIPAEVLAKGENVITLTNDANVNDGWTAANLHLEIHGVLSGPPAASLESTLPAPSTLEVGATAIISGTIPLTSSYELAQGQVITQLVSYQIPMSYTGSVSVPLIIGIHGYGSTGEWIRDYLAPEANERGWLLAAPDMHGRYYVNTGKYALAYVGAQHDVIDTIAYMMSEFEVDSSRIYIYGGSMGGQIATVMAAKYPDVFPAVAESSGFTDLADWYDELDALGDYDEVLMRIRNETGGPPSSTDPSVVFEYERRSAMAMPQNSRLIPLHMWHNEADQLVPVHHSFDLAAAINSWSPPTPVTVTTVITAGCAYPYHCYAPPLDDIFDYLAGFSRDSQPAPSAALRTDESKPYYWLDIAQAGSDHWCRVEASYALTNTTVTASIWETSPLTVAFNLGSTLMMGRVIAQPGMGLPATTYLVKGGGDHYLYNYTSGYLTTTVTQTGQFSLTISAIEVQVSAQPDTVSGLQTATSTITAMLTDRLGNPVPDGTTVHFSTTEGTFPNASSTYTATAKEGVVTTTLTLEPSDDLAEIIASVESVAGFTSVDVVRFNVYLPAITKNP